MQAFAQAVFASPCCASILPGSVSPESDVDEFMARVLTSTKTIYRSINCTTSFSILDYGRHLRVYTGENTTHALVSTWAQVDYEEEA